MCNNPHLDILVDNESSQYFYTLGYYSTATAFISLMFEELVNQESELDLFFLLGWYIAYFVVKLILLC